MKTDMDLKHVLGRTWVIEGSGLMGLYRLDGGKCILLDSGEVFEREALGELLDRHGLTPIGVLCSHVHVDHSINNGWLRERYGTLAAVPAGEVQITRTPVAMKAYFYSASPDSLAREFQGMASPVDALIPWDARTPWMNCVFSFCGVDFRIIHTPGHSMDHVAIVTPDNVCYVGDAVLSNEVLESKLPYHIYLDMAISSAEKLRDTNCAAYIVAHRGIHTDINAVVEASNAHIRKRAEEIRALVTRPMTFSEIWAAVNEAFSLLSSRPIRAALMERNLRSFVDYLVDQGKLACSAERGMLYYAPTEDKHEA